MALEDAGDEVDRAISRATTPNPNFGVSLTADPNRLVLLGLAFGQGAVSLPGGCEILLDTSAIVTRFGHTDAEGIADFTLPIPQLNGFWINQVFHAQCVIEDPTSPLGGLSLSQGLRIHTGI